MGYFLDKQPSSRPIRLLELDYSGSGTQATTPVGTQTYQVRIGSDVRDYVAFGSNGVTTSSRDTATVEIFPNLRGEYGPDYVGKYNQVTDNAHLEGDDAWQANRLSPAEPKTGDRAKGAKNRLSHAAEDFEQHGVEALKIARIEKPVEYIRIVAGLMPKEIWNHRLAPNRFIWRGIGCFHC